MMLNIGILVLSLLLTLNLDDSILRMFGYIGAFLTFNLFLTFLLGDGLEENNEDNRKNE